MSLNARPLRLREGPGPGVTITRAAAELLATSTSVRLALNFHDGDQVTTNLPGVDAAALAHLDDDGLAQIGSLVSPGMILIGRLARARPEEDDGADAAIDAAFSAEPGRDGSLRCPPDVSGRVESIEHVNALTKKDVPSLPEGERVGERAYRAYRLPRRPSSITINNITSPPPSAPHPHPRGATHWPLSQVLCPGHAVQRSPLVPHVASALPG